LQGLAQADPSLFCSRFALQALPPLAALFLLTLIFFVLPAETFPEGSKAHSEWFTALGWGISLGARFLGIHKKRRT
jgi:hypothetical protein